MVEYYNDKGELFSRPYHEFITKFKFLDGKTGEELK